MRHADLVSLIHPDEPFERVRLLQHQGVEVNMAVVPSLEVCVHVVDLDGTDELERDERAVLLIRLSRLYSEHAVNLILVDYAQVVLIMEPDTRGDHLDRIEASGVVN